MFRRRHMHSSKCCHYFCPPLSRKRGDIKSHSSVRPSLPPSVRLSVTKTLTWLISFEVLMIEHWYLTCMIIVTSPFYWYHAVTLTFDLSQGQIWCRAGDHNSSNFYFYIYYEETFHHWSSCQKGTTWRAVQCFHKTKFLSFTTRYFVICWAIE